MIHVIVNCLPTEPKGPELDLAFAVNVAQQNLKLVKETVQGMIDLYGVGRVHYGFIVFGSSAVIKIPFTDQVTERTKLKKSVNDALSSTNSSPNLDKALEEAETLFQGSKRGQANKILIVIMDKLSPSEPTIVKVDDICCFFFLLKRAPVLQNGRWKVSIRSPLRKTELMYS